MDVRCNIIYRIRNFDCYKKYVNYYVDPYHNVIPFYSDYYCLYLASSISILRKYITVKLPCTINLEYVRLLHYIPSNVMGNKFILEERNDEDVRTILKERPRVCKLLYVDFTQLVACYVANSPTFDFDHMFDIMSQFTDEEPHVMRLTYRCHDSNDLHVKTVDDTIEILKLMDECKKIVDHYRSNMVETIAYCMLNCNEINGDLIERAITRLNIDFDDVDKYVKSQLKM